MGSSVGGCGDTVGGGAGGSILGVNVIDPLATTGELFSITSSFDLGDSGESAWHIFSNSSSDHRSS